MRTRLRRSILLGLVCSLNLALSTGDATADWLETGHLDFGAGETCGQLKLDPGDRPVVLCTTTAGRVTQGFVKRFSNGVWETLGGGTFNADVAQRVLTARLALKADGTPVVAWVETSRATNLVYLKELCEIAWCALGGALNIDPTKPLNSSYASPELDLALDSSGAPVVAFVEAASVYARRYRSGAWATLGGGIVPESGQTIFSAPSTVKLLVGPDGSVHVFWIIVQTAYLTPIYHQRWSGSWTTDTGYSSYAVFDYQPFLDQNLRLSLKVGSGKYLYDRGVLVQRLEGGTWKPLMVSSDGRSVAISSDAAMGRDGHLVVIWIESRTGYPEFNGSEVLAGRYRNGSVQRLGGSLGIDASVPAGASPDQVLIALDASDTPIVGLVSPSGLVLKRFSR